jgi:hypothetical protein
MNVVIESCAVASHVQPAQISAVQTHFGMTTRKLRLTWFAGECCGL